jgi:DNA-3-methyladenine glycosylase I
LGESFVDLVWSYHDQRSRPRTLSDVPSTSPTSIALSRELRKRGIQFLGPTTAYAMMQAIGLVDDHLTDCFVPVPRLPRRASDTE